MVHAIRYITKNKHFTKNIPLKLIHEITTPLHFHRSDDINTASFIQDNYNQLILVSGNYDHLQLTIK